MIRSVLAVLAGIVVLTVTSFAIEAATDPLLMRMFPRALPNAAAMSQNVPAKLFMIFYTILCVAAGGYVTAWLARRSEVWHAVIMGAIEVLLTVCAMIALPGHAPLWSWMVGLALVVPAAWLGGMIRTKQTAIRLS
jgi:hypothetical protein